MLLLLLLLAWLLLLPLRLLLLLPTRVRGQAPLPGQPPRVGQRGQQWAALEGGAAQGGWRVRKPSRRASCWELRVRGAGGGGCKGGRGGGGGGE